MSLVEICSSKYNHFPLESETFGKKYYKLFNGTSIICEECIDAYINDISNKLMDIIVRCLETVNIKDLILRNNDYSDNELNIITNISTSEYMEYKLPIKFSVKSKLFCKECISDIEVEYEETPYKIINISVESINCPDIFPIFKMTFDIKDIDTNEDIRKLISDYVSSYINIIYDELSDDIVKILMVNHASKKYTAESTCACSSASSPHCAICNNSTLTEKYIYNNKEYCLDCMYGIVVKLARENNVTDEVGLSVYEQLTGYTIVSDQEWKRYIISKYENVMNSLGIETRIVHYTMTITG